MYATVLKTAGIALKTKETAPRIAGIAEIKKQQKSKGLSKMNAEPFFNNYSLSSVLFFLLPLAFQLQIIQEIDHLQR